MSACVIRTSSNLAPSIYLNRFIEEIDNGRDMQDVFREILSVYEKIKINDDMEISWFMDWEQVKERMKTINRDEEQLKKDIFYEINCAQSDYNSDYVELPKEVDGEEVIYKKRESGNYAAAVLFCGISLAIFAHYHDKEKKNSYEKEKIKQMNCDYPEIVAKLSLLVGAGMTVRMAWEKIVVDYRVRQKSGSKKRYAYEFMSEGLNMLKSGKPQIYVYEEFGMKCGIKEYMKFSSLIVQNIKKGTKELALLLTLEAKDAFEERKNMAKKYGEEAGTKLLLPMIIMLIVVMAIIMVPALMSFSGY